jgi:hypothetical protein
MTTSRDMVERLVQSRDESTEVRSLLDAGIADDVTDYDFARGLETHLSAIGAAPGGGGPAAPASAAPGASSAAGATSAKALALAIGVPVVSAIAALAVFVTHDGASSSAASVTGARNAPVETAVVAERAREPAAAVAPPAEPNVNDGPAISPSEGVLRSGSHATSTAQRNAISQPSKVALAESEATASRHVVAAGESDDRGMIHRNFPEGPVESRHAMAEWTGIGASSARASAPLPASPVVRDEPRPSEDELARAERARQDARKNAEDTLQREMDELMRAKRALSQNPQLALELAERGQREFKQSLLTEEREHVLLLALIGVGRVSEAERRAAPYLARHPDSPFARRVRAALEARKSR